MRQQASTCYAIEVPDRSDWHPEHDYSRPVGEALVAAYASIQRRRDFSHARKLMHPYLKASMASQQRLRFCYAQAIVCAADSQFGKALKWLGEAMSLAAQDTDPASRLLLHYLRGSICRSCLRLEQAVDDFRTCLQLLDEGAEASLEEAAQLGTGPTSRVELLTSLVGFEFYLEQYDLAQQHLRAAQSLFSPAEERSLEAAGIVWMQALVNHLTGSLDQALSNALVAADIYTELGSAASAGRIHTVVVDILLDLAMTLPAGPVREGLISSAHPHIHLGLSLAREAGDPIGVGMVLLRRVRYQRVIGLGQATNRLALIKWVLGCARKVWDSGLFVQGLTSLGDEFTSLKDYSTAEYFYKQAVEVAKEAHIPALSVWARRALR